jgi:phospholipid/cholesterol/gamma-HCH transport system substrate-binding protein
METRANYATIGIFTLIVIALAFGFIYWLKRYDETGTRVDLPLEFVGTVNGLAKGGAVYFNGIKVGEVTYLSFDPGDPKRVHVVASIAGATPVKADSRVEVNYNFLTGVAYVELFGGSADLPPILAQVPVPALSGSSATLNDMIAGASRVMQSAQKSVEEVNQLLVELRPSVANSIKNVETFTEALSSNAPGVQKFLDSVSSMSETVAALSTKLEAVVDKADATIAAIDPDKVRETIDSANSVIKRIDAASADIGPMVADARRTAAELSRFSTGLNTSLTDLNKVVAAVDPEKVRTSIDGISNFAGKLGNASKDFDQIVADAKATADRVNRFTERLEGRTDDIDTIIAEAKQLTQRVNAASTRLDSLLGKAEDFLGTEGGENFFTEATAAARSFRQVAETFDRRANEIASGLAKFSGRGLDNVQALVDELRLSVNRIDRVVSTIEKNPSSVIFGSNSGVRDYNRR